MTITEEHFEALRQVREAAEDLKLACIEATGTGSLLHVAFDPSISLQPMKNEAAYLGKLRAVK